MPYPFYKINPSYCYKRTHVKYIKEKYNLSFKLQILRVTTFVLNQNNDLKEKKNKQKSQKNEKKFVDDCSKKYCSKEN